MRNGGYGQFITRLCHSSLLRGGLLALCPSSSVRSLSQETVLHKLLQRESFPQAAALHKLLQRGSPRGHKPGQQTCSGLGSSLHGAAGPGRSLLQHGLPTGSQPPLGIPLLWCGVPSTGCRWRSAPLWTSMGCRDSLPHDGLHHGLQGNLCSGTWSTSSPSFYTDLGVCRVVSLTLSHSSLYAAVSPQYFFSSVLILLSQGCYHRR